MLTKWELMFADSLTIFGGILSRSVAFLGFVFLVILFISSIFAVGMSNLIARESMWFLMFIILMWFSYCLMIFSTVVLSSLVLLGFPLVNGGTPDVISTVLLLWRINKLAYFVFSIKES